MATFPYFSNFCKARVTKQGKKETLGLKETIRTSRITASGFFFLSQSYIKALRNHST